MVASGGQWLGRQTTRRRALKGGVALTGVAALAAACGGDDDGPSSAGGASAPAGGTSAAATRTDPASVKRGGVLRRGAAVSPVDVDVHVQPVGLSQQITARMYNHIMKFTPDLQIVPDLGESYEQPDPATYIWKVRQGVRFQNIPPVNGRPLVAADFTNSLQRLMDTPSEYKSFLQDLTVAMETPDDRTFVYKGKEPSAPFLSIVIANPHGGIYPQEILAAFGDLKTRGVGTGPFILDSFKPTEKIVLRKNPDYWEKDLPYLDGMEWTIIPDQAALRAAFKAKQLDMNGATLTKPLLDEIKAGGGVEVISTPSLSTKFHMLGKVDRPPFNDMRVREAFDLVINRDTFIQRIAFGDGKPCGPVPWGHERYALPQEEIKAAYKTDVQKAKQLMSAAGYANGFDLVHTTVPSIQLWADLGAILQEQLRQINVRMTFDNTELGDYLANRLFKAEFQSMALGTNPYEEPDEFLSYFHSRGRSGINWSNYANAEVDNLINAERRELNTQKRQEIFMQAQRKILSEHGPWLALYNENLYTAYHNYVKNVPLALALSEAYVYDYWLDK
jgi:peptide/nickel transport system substrate-binding protein